ncbi:MAG: tetratricopeptide repeat protein [Candidatus Methylacidiphilales bacterium]
MNLRNHLICLLVVCATGAPAQEEAGRPSSAKVVNIDDLKPPADQLMREAVALQSGGEPARAAAVLADVLRYYPDTESKPEILFRLAECYRALGRFPEAREALALLRGQFEKSSWQLPGYLLSGEMSASEDRWQEALEDFKKAARSKEARVKVRALYLQSVSALRIKNTKEAAAALTALRAVEKENPHRDFAFLKSGELAAAEGKDADASQFFKQAISLTTQAPLRAEAAVRAGNLERKRGNLADAVVFYEMARKLDAPDVWRELAHFGLVQAYFTAENFADVVRIFNEVKPAFPEDTRDAVLFMVAEAQRMQGNSAEAMGLYEVLLKESKNDPLVQAAMWGRVLILQTQGSTKAGDAAAAYLARYPDGPEVVRAQLIRADAFFLKRDFSTAAPMYEELLKEPAKLEAVSGAVLRQTWLRAGVCSYGLEKYEAATNWLRIFLEASVKAKDDTGRVDALWLLGQSHLALKQFKEAVPILEQLVVEQPHFAQREDLLWKTAFAYGSLKQFEGMKRMLERVLAEFPSDGRKGELYQWLAVASENLGQEKDAFEYWGKARLVEKEAYFERATRYRIQYALKSKNLDVLVDEVGRYEAWREKNPKSESLGSELREWLAQELEAVNRIDEAEMEYRGVLATSNEAEQQKRVRLKLARMMTKIMRHGAAVREWELFRAAYPDDADHPDVLGSLVDGYLGSADFEKARTLTELLLRQNPEGVENVKARLLLGDIDMARGNYQEAAKIYRAVSLLALDDRLVPLALQRAERAFRRAGMEKEADSLLLQLRKEFPDFDPRGEPVAVSLLDLKKQDIIKP